MSVWTDFVKRWAAENNTTYSCALSDPRCKAAYSPPAKGAKKEKKEVMPKPPKPPKTPRPPKKATAKNPIVGVAKKLYKRQDAAREQLYQLKNQKEKRIVANAEPMFGISPQRLVANSAPPSPPSYEPFGISPSKAMGIF